jgi:predicted PurR-regulated permease PerM
VQLALRALGALVLCAVLGGALTFLLWPLWSWVEAFTGFESMGHSGPAPWCFVLVTALLWGGWWAARARDTRA